jgi:putative Mn2+ efflux pump MntP
MFGIIPVLLIAVSLSLDAFAVSISAGICMPGLQKRYALRASFFFGLFQFVMPIAGWFLGAVFEDRIKSFDHWIAFVLAFVGGKMIVEALPLGKPADSSSSGPVDCKTTDIRNIKTLMLLALATSIDALAVGVSLSITGENILGSSVLIGAVTLVVCLFGFEFGRRIGVVFEKWAELIGGIILIGIGIKILVEHLVFT